MITPKRLAVLQAFQFARRYRRDRQWLLNATPEEREIVRRWMEQEQMRKRKQGRTTQTQRSNHADQSL